MSSCIGSLIFSCFGLQQYKRKVLSSCYTAERVLSSYILCVRLCFLHFPKNKCFFWKRQKSHLKCEKCCRLYWTFWEWRHLHLALQYLNDLETCLWYTDIMPWVIWALHFRFLLLPKFSVYSISHLGTLRGARWYTFSEDQRPNIQSINVLRYEWDSLPAVLQKYGNINISLNFIESMIYTQQSSVQIHRTIYTIVRGCEGDHSV